MTINLELTPEQEKAVTLSNASANPDGKTATEDFVITIVSEKLNEHVAAWRQRQVAELKSVIDAKAADLTDDDLAALKATLSGEVDSKLAAKKG